MTLLAIVAATGFATLAIGIYGIAKGIDKMITLLEQIRNRLDKLVERKFDDWN